MTEETAWILLILVAEGMISRLLTTELLECAAAAIYPKRNLHDLLLTLLVNLITNPAAVFLDFLLRNRMASPVLWVICLEGVIWFSEGMIYRSTLKRQTNPWLYSFVLNITSYVVGQFLQMIYG